jgi:hypothetical protein
MKYIKLYEELNAKIPQIHDYVLCVESEYEDETINESEINLNNFISSNIGIIIDMVKTDVKFKYDYHIKYENVPDDISMYFEYDNTRWSVKSDIIHWSKDREDLETLLTAKKYNL